MKHVGNGESDWMLLRNWDEIAASTLAQDTNQSICVLACYELEQNGPSSAGLKPSAA